MIDFYCDRHGDFEAEYFVRENQWGKWFIAKCPKCKTECVRYGTDKHLDPYFRKSKKMRIERDKYRDDLVQPSEPRFKSLYPEQWAKMERAKEKWEQKRANEKKERDKFYKDNFNERSITKKVLEKEEELDDKGN